MLFQALLLLFQGAQAAQLHPGEVLEGPKGKQHLPGARGSGRAHLGTPEWHLNQEQDTGMHSTEKYLEMKTAKERMDKPSDP